MSAPAHGLLSVKKERDNMVDVKVEVEMTDNSYIESRPFIKNGKQYVCELKIKNLTFLAL